MKWEQDAHSPEGGRIPTRRREAISDCPLQTSSTDQHVINFLNRCQTWACSIREYVAEPVAFAPLSLDAGFVTGPGVLRRVASSNRLRVGLRNAYRLGVQWYRFASGGFSIALELADHQGR